MGNPFPIRVHQFCAYQKYGMSIFEDGIAVRHLNNQSLDNSLGNIGIGTYSENMMDKPKTQRIWQAHLAGLGMARKDWDKIDKARISGMSYKKLAKIYGVPLSSLSYRYGYGKRSKLTTEKLAELQNLYDWIQPCKK